MTQYWYLFFPNCNMISEKFQILGNTKCFQYHPELTSKLIYIPPLMIRQYQSTIERRGLSKLSWRCWFWDRSLLLIHFNFDIWEYRSTLISLLGVGYHHENDRPSRRIFSDLKERESIIILRFTLCSRPCIQQPWLLLLICRWRCLQSEPNDEPYPQHLHHQ